MADWVPVLIAVAVVGIVAVATIVHERRGRARARDERDAIAASIALNRPGTLRDLRHGRVTRVGEHRLSVRVESLGVVTAYRLPDTGAFEVGDRAALVDAPGVGWLCIGILAPVEEP